MSAYIYSINVHNHSIGACNISLKFAAHAIITLKSSLIQT